MIAKEFLLQLLPDIDKRDKRIYDCEFDLAVDSHTQFHLARAVWYWSKTEGRFTRVGRSVSPLLDIENTGTIAVFVIEENQTTERPLCRAWVCEAEGTEADLIEERIGAVEPKQFVLWKPGHSDPQGNLFGDTKKSGSSCWLSREDIPPDWLIKFPTGREIVQKTIALRSSTTIIPDARLLKRRDCEFELFRSIEQEYYRDRISTGFEDMESFIALSNTVLQSRKSRAGKSLEYHTIEILNEEGFAPDLDYSHNVEVNGKRPDFLFPSKEAYLDPDMSKENLYMLAVKTTLKDRWRQILNEVDRDRINTAHLLTLQEGVSQNQFDEMTDENVQLVVPAKLHRAYPEAIRPHLLTLEDFISNTRHLRLR